MTWRLSARSLAHLSGVKPHLQIVVRRALAVSKIDFGVIDGLRTKAEQRALIERGASQTMKSKHITGDAIDVMAYIGSRGSWENELYCQIADAFRQAADELNVGIRWGGAWHISDIRKWPKDTPMADLQDDYVRKRVSEGRRPFLDSGHFELTETATEDEDEEEDD